MESKEESYYSVEKEGKRAFIPAITKGVWEISHNEEPRLLCSGKVVAVLVRHQSGLVFEIEKGMHIDVLRVHDISPHEVTQTGWKLEDGTEVWR